MWLISSNTAYNTERFEEIAAAGNNVVGYKDGKKVILRHMSFSEDAKSIYKEILKSIEKGNKVYYL